MSDEFAGCSLEDVAVAIAYTSGEDQQRAIAAFHRRSPAPAPGIGHNNPPPGDDLDEVIEVWRAEHDALIAAAGAAAIVDVETAAKVQDLVVKMRDYEDRIDEARKARTAPLRQAETTINSRFNRLRLEIEVARQGSDRRGGLRGLLRVWDDRQKAAAAEAAEKARREARAKEIAAEEARKRLADAEASGRGVAVAEVAVLRAEGAADAAAAQAERAGRPTPVHSNLGTGSRRREIVREVRDYGQCIAWMLGEQSGLAAKLREAVDAILDRYLRSLGVATVEKGGVRIPGVSVSTREGEIFVRR